jgi:protein TonB
VPTAPAAAPQPSAEQQGEALAAWRKSLSAWLNAHRRYPEQARHDGVQGQPTVRFTVEPSGHVTNVEIVASSGSTVLDEATIEMLRGATLPPFPPGLTQGEMTASVRVRYSLEQ